jgi:putative hydrolase of the HAD superfamily
MNRPALIFDFGNVVAHFDYAVATARLGEPIGLSGPELLERARAAGLNDLVKRYESGRMTSEEFSASVCRLVGLEATHEEFAAAWGDIFRLNDSVAELIPRLKRSGHRLVLGSNTNEMHARVFRPQFAETLRHFDALALSYEVGHIKPSAEFYLACASMAGEAPERCVFIDDLPENVEGAQRAGLQGLLYTETPRLIADLRASGAIL